MAAEAVDFRLARDGPARVRRFILRFGFGRTATGKMTTEKKRQIPRREAEVGRLEHALPGPLGKRDLGSGALVQPNPRLSRPSGGRVRRRGVEMPAGLDRFVIMAGGAGRPGREGEGIGFRGDDLLAEFVIERNPVDGRGPASGPFRRSLGLSRGQDENNRGRGGQNRSGEGPCPA